MNKENVEFTCCVCGTVLNECDCFCKRCLEDAEKEQQFEEYLDSLEYDI